MKYVVVLAVIIAFAALEYFLRRLKHWETGFIVPLAFMLFVVWYSMNHITNADDWMEFGIIFLGLLAIWIKARETGRKERAKELNKMEAQDLENSADNIFKKG